MLTQVGDSIAASPSNVQSDAMKILYWLRRHGGRGTDDQIKTFTGLSDGEVQVALNKLTRGNAPPIRVVG